MLTVQAIGRPTADLELKSGKNDSTYCFFNLAVNLGYGDNQTTEFVECKAFNSIAERLQKAKVGKGSLIEVEGDAVPKGFKRKNGEPGASLVMEVTNWHYIPSSGKKDAGSSGQSTDQESAQSAAVAATIKDAPESGTVDGDGDLPW